MEVVEEVVEQGPGRSRARVEEVRGRSQASSQARSLAALFGYQSQVLLRVKFDDNNQAIAEFVPVEETRPVNVGCTEARGCRRRVHSKVKAHKLDKFARIEAFFKGARKQLELSVHKHLELLSPTTVEAQFSQERSLFRLESCTDIIFFCGARCEPSLGHYKATKQSKGNARETGKKRVFA